jgi:fatty-acyl-CoA synthase
MLTSVKEWLEVVNNQFSDKVAYIDENGNKTTYKQLIFLAKKAAAVLKANKIERGDHIAIWLPNQLEWVALEIACGMLGVTNVALNPKYSSYEVAYMLKQSDAKALFYNDDLVDSTVIKELLPELFEVEKATSFTSFSMLITVFSMSNKKPKGAVAFHDSLNQVNIVKDDEIHFEADPNQPLNILYTSGTSSKPKGALLSQRNIIGHSYNTAERMNITKEDNCLLILPFCGIFGLNSLWQVLTKGATVISLSSFDVAQICHFIEKYKCTVFNAIDQIYMKLIDYKKNHPIDLSSLRIGAAGMFIYDSLEIINQIEEDLHYRILHTYGMSEVGSMLFLRDPDEVRENRAVSGGIPVSGDVKIIDPNTMQELGDGQMGEMVIKGLSVMLGYYKKQDVTKHSFLENGYFLTGDLGIKHPEGVVEYLGRRREAFRIAGFLVTPLEIEEFISHIKGVDLAKAVGIERNGKTEVVCFVKLDNTQSLTAKEIEAVCQQLAYFKRPRHIFIVDEFPKSYGANGEKIRRDALMEMAKEQVK